MRRRYVWSPEKNELVEITASQATETAHYVQPDIQPYVSPVTGEVISSRSEHRAHMHQHNLAPVDDFKEHFAKARRERELRQAGMHPEQRADRINRLRDSFEHVRNQQRAKRGY